MELSLPPQLEEFVRAQVRSGRYADEQEVVRDALRQMRALVKAAEDPTVVGLVRDAIGMATQAQREVAGMLQVADKEQSCSATCSRHAGTARGDRATTRCARCRARVSSIASSGCRSAA